MSAPSPDALARVDRLFADWLETQGRAPGLAWGVVADGRLVHTGGAGTLRVGEDRPPGPEAVFRIASMTKSFIAATVLLLRDEGRLRLDDPVEEHVPELHGLPRPTADSPAPTIRDVLAMRSGYPEDDPWADRLEAMADADYLALMATPKTHARPAGVAFDYSNIGFTLLGRVIANATGIPYHDVVRERLLRPLGLDDTTWDGRGTGTRRAMGYARVDDTWVEQPHQAPGAFSALGGLHSTVADLAVWVAGMLDAWPPRDAPDTHPLGRASRREMQQVQTALPLQVDPSRPGLLAARQDGYCLGLLSREDLATGRTVGHSGGYPGFGSHMRWHPATGFGVIALANGRYAAPGGPAIEALDLLVTETPARATVEPLPALVALRDAIDRALAAGDLAPLEPLLADNVALDEPLERRRAAIGELGTRHGRLTATPDLDVLTPTEAEWRLAGERGYVVVRAMLTPEDPPRLQRLDIESALEPSAALIRAAESAVARLRDDDALSPALGPDPAVEWIACDGSSTGVVRVRGRDLAVRIAVDLEEPEPARLEAEERYPRPW